MSKGFTVIVVSIIFFTAVAFLCADEKGDKEKAPALEKELENQQPADLQQAPLPAEAGRQPAARRPVRALGNNQVEIDVAPRRIGADRPQPPVRQQAPARLRQFLQAQNRWFNALKDAYRENDMDRIGRLIDKMEQFREQMRNRMESAQQLRPLVRQRRRADEGYQPQGRMRNFRAWRRGRGPIDEAPAFRRQMRQEQQRRFRMQDMPKQQFQRPAAPPVQWYCEKCRQLRARQQRRLQPPMGEDRGPERLGRYEEGIQQRRFRQQRGWRQQELPRENVPENEELDFDWDW